MPNGRKSVDAEGVASGIAAAGIRPMREQNAEYAGQAR